MLRIATALVLAPLLWVLIKLAPEWAFLSIAGAGIVAACWECYRMLETRGSRPFKKLGLLATVGIVWVFANPMPGFDVALPLVAVTLLAMLRAMREREDPGAMLDSVTSTVVPLTLIGLCLAYVLRLRTTPGEDGEDLVLLLFFCVILADTAAYYVGSSLGRHRMAPQLSPKKSWEGLVGGLIGSLIGALVAHFWFYQRLPLTHAISLGVVLGIAAVFGDLAESVLKRAAGVKDSSSLLPGHGGLLDRTDSLLFAAPVLYYYAAVFLEVGS